MRKFFSLFLALAALLLVWFQLARSPALSSSVVSNETVTTAFRSHQSDVQVSGVGVVNRVLPDDREGGRHQRFTLQLTGIGQTVLIAHNIDIAPRIPALQPGNTVSFNGVYEWNDKGGVVHWTHRDPDGKHQTGWLKHKGKTFQ